MNGNGTELEQVVDTHRTSCRSGWPRDFGALNPSPRHSFFFFCSRSNVLHELARKRLLRRLFIP